MPKLYFVFVFGLSLKKLSILGCLAECGFGVVGDSLRRFVPNFAGLADVLMLGGSSSLCFNSGEIT